MKYNICGFYQPKLVEFKLNAVDAQILRWFVDFQPKMSSIEHDGVKYLWVKYQAVIDDLPTLEINNREVIARRFGKMVESGIMDKYVSRDGGTFTGYRLTKKYLELVEFINIEPVDLKVDPSTQKSGGVYQKVDTPIYSKVETKDSSIKRDPSIKSNRKKHTKKDEPVFDCSGFENQEVKAIEDWLIYRKQIKKPYRSQSGLTQLRNSLLELQAQGILERSIYHSIANEWVGVYPPKDFVQRQATGFDEPRHPPITDDVARGMFATNVPPEPENYHSNGGNSNV